MYHLKFYADCPDNQKNKLFCYPVHDGKHACDLLARFLAKEFRLRAAFLGNQGDKGARLTSDVVNYPSSVGVVRTMLLKYPPRIDVAALSDKEASELLAQFPHLRAAVEKLRVTA